MDYTAVAMLVHAVCTGVHVCAMYSSLNIPMASEEHI